MSPTGESFARWLAAQRHRDDPIGDLARDLARDRGYRVTTPETLRGHLLDRQACPAACVAVGRAESEWRTP